jgi:hypothetical protein
MLTSRKSVKYDSWCCLFAVSCLLVKLTCFHQYIGPTVSVNCNEILVVIYAQNRRCTAMLAAPIIGHDIIFTLFGVTSFSAFFSQLRTGFKGREGVGIERKTSYWPSIIQNSC